MNNVKLFDNLFDVTHNVKCERPEGFPIDRNAYKSNA